MVCGPWMSDWEFDLTIYSIVSILSCRSTKQSIGHIVCTSTSFPHIQLSSGGIELLGKWICSWNLSKHTFISFLFNSELVSLDPVWKLSLSVLCTAKQCWGQCMMGFFPSSTSVIYIDRDLLFSAVLLQLSIVYHWGVDNSVQPYSVFWTWMCVWLEMLLRPI